MKYFSYGSNMSLVRLKARTPSGVRLGTFILNEHQLCFHKASDDGSGKCDVINTKRSDDRVIGALFEIDQSLKPYAWYLNHIVIGAKEIAVAPHYLKQLDPCSKYSKYL